MTRTSTTVLVACVVALTACGVGPGRIDPSRTEQAWVVVGGGPSPGVSDGIENIGPSPIDPGDTATDGAAPPDDPASATPLASDAPRYVACARTAPPPGSTHLSPVAAIDASNDTQPGGQPIPRGVIKVESGGTLPLDDGVLVAGNGYEAAIGGGRTFQVATGAVDAPVTLVVLDSPKAGRRVAFVEVRLSAAAPVRWVQQPALNIVTDGGDGGFGADVPPLRDDQASIDNYVDAFYPNGDNGSGNVCVQRIASTGRLESVLFSTGYGDGVYGSFLGYDSAGHIVAVVHSGDVLPWSMSGLSGTRPLASETW